MMGNPNQGAQFGFNRFMDENPPVGGTEPTPIQPPIQTIQPPVPTPISGVVSDIVGGTGGVASPAVSFANPQASANPMMSETEWRDKYRQEFEARQKAPSGVVSQAVQTPITPAPVTPKPAVPAKKKKKTPKTVETNPYELWKQGGRKGPPPV